MNRRQFITSGVMASATFFGGFSAIAQGTLGDWNLKNTHAGRIPRGTGRPPAIIRKAISLGMIQDGTSVLDKYLIAKDCGIQGLELNAPVSDDTLKEYIQARNKAEIPTAGIMFAGNWSQNLGDPDPEKRNIAIESVTKALQQAKEVGAPHVLVVPGVVNANVDYESVWKYSLESLFRLLPAVEETRVKIGIENVWNNFLLSPIEMAQYVDQVNNPRVGCLFDIGNILRYGWPEHWIRTLNHRIVNLHIKGFNTSLADSKGKWAGFGVEMQDEGDFSWEPIAKALVDISFRGYLIAEVGGGKKERIQDISNRLQKMVDLVQKTTDEKNNQV